MHFLLWNKIKQEDENILMHKFSIQHTYEHVCILWWCKQQKQAASQIIVKLLGKERKGQF